MPEEPFQPEDLRLLNLILPLYPDVVDVIRAAKHAVARVKYPVQSFDELAAALGDGVTLAGGSLGLAEARRLLPAYYFPISSEEDLIAKVADLRAQAGAVAALPVAGDVTWAPAIDKPPENSRPPQIAPADLPMSLGAGGVKKPAQEAPAS
jgi:hypothetical protein